MIFELIYMKLITYLTILSKNNFWKHDFINLLSYIFLL